MVNHNRVDLAVHIWAEVYFIYLGLGFSVLCKPSPSVVVCLQFSGHWVT